MEGTLWRAGKIEGKVVEFTVDLAECLLVDMEGLFVEEGGDAVAVGW